MRSAEFPTIVSGLCALAVGLAFVACSSSTKGGSGFNDDPTTKPTGGQGTTAGTGTGGTGDGNGPVLGDVDASAPASGGCAPSPANVEIAGNGCDDDADGTVDNVKVCDTGLAVAGDGMAFAKALGLCQTATGATDTKWGVISATYSNGHGKTGAPNAAQHGILPKFGSVIKPREGSALGVISTGFAREFDDANGTTGIFKKSADSILLGMQPGASGGLPPGFPRAAAGCAGATDVHDTIVVKLDIKTPANAKGISFDFNFWSGEWPEYVCTSFNDGFIAYLKSSAVNGGAADNISFDAQKNPVSVNNGFFDRCTANAKTGCADLAGGVVKTAACPGGTAELQGTGFAGPVDKYCTGNGVIATSSGGATGWLTSTAPVAPNEVITLEFIIWDTGDANFDSSVLLDKLQWIPGEVTVVTERPK